MIESGRLSKPGLKGRKKLLSKPTSKQYYGSGKRSEDNSKSLKDKKILQYYMKNIKIFNFHNPFYILQIYNPLYVLLAFTQLKL
jgi:hypothetical protein